VGVWMLTKTLAVELGITVDQTRCKSQSIFAGLRRWLRT
jgi:hypothetical protein